MSRFSIIATIMLTLCVGTRSTASVVRHVNLEEMTGSADRVFLGRVVEMRFEHGPAGRPVTIVTFDVDQVVKGDLGASLTIRLRGDRRGESPTRRHDQPIFREGEEVVLFLYGDSSTGMTNPVGLHQGKFVVTVDKDGHRRAVNLYGNRGLLSNLTPAAFERLDVVREPGTRGDRLAPDHLLDCATRLVELSVRGGER